ncbi:MAG TPA: response regulator [Opitutaceae bacterium]
MNRAVPAGRYVVVEVVDSGCGIPREVVDRIFEPFFTTKGPGKGTGLGLSTALGIVRSHGGVVTVESEPARGSVFKVYLPAKDADASDLALAQASTPSPRGQGQLILLVEDDASVLAITQQTLQLHGYEIMTAEDGAQAMGLYAMHRDRIRLVVTDMMMPVMEGAAFIAALRRMDPGIRIIATSGLHGNAIKASNAGVHDFLEKPYTAHALLALVARVLTD